MNLIQKKKKLPNDNSDTLNGSNSTENDGKEGDTDDEETGRGEKGAGTNKQEIDL